MEVAPKPKRKNVGATHVSVIIAQRNLKQQRHITATVAPLYRKKRFSRP